MFPLSIISAAIILNRRACYIMATLSSIFYGILIDLQYFKIINLTTSLIFTEKDFFYNIFAHMTAFYLIAFLSGVLSAKLHKVTMSLEERDTVLSDLKAFSKYVIESMPSGVFTTGLDRNIVTFNTSAQLITKLSHDDVAGKKPEDIFPFIDHSNGPSERIEGEIRIDRKNVPIGMRLSNLKDASGNSIGMIGVFQDLTKLKAMEAEVKRKEKWAVIGELSASIAHELRNPLAALKGSVEMLKEKKVSEEHADRLMNIALSEMDRLNDIVTNFLLYARPQKLNKKPFDLHRTLGEVVTLLKHSETDNKHVTISANLEGDELITGDTGQLRQVFWNLGLNAMDAISDKGTVGIHTQKENNSINIIFKDSGSGISKGNIDKIFYPFYTTKDSGTGLGLAIALKIVEDHGGKIKVHSDGSGMGTTFKVILPLNV
jgi:two-component system sensor histidine kinase PilS (NtrC family)